MFRIAILDHAYSIEELDGLIREAGHARAYDLAGADIVFLGHQRHATPDDVRRRGFHGPIVSLGCSCTPQPEQHEGHWLCTETASARDIAGLVASIEVRSSRSAA